MSVFERCLEKCRARKGAVVYSDGEDRRVVSAAAKLIREGLVEPILIGDPEKVRAALQESGETGVSLQVVNPYNPALLQHNAAEYMSIQKDKGKDISEEEAIKAVQEPSRRRCPLWSAAVKPKSALPGTCPPRPTSSAPACACRHRRRKQDRVKLLLHAEGQQRLHVHRLRGHSGTHFRAACGHCDQHRRRVQARHGRRGRVALLSFSTKGSAKHERVDKVRAALEEIKTREPNLLVDGELQLDAAVEPEVARLKAPGSRSLGTRTCSCSPPLKPGNIGYKIAQRLRRLDGPRPPAPGLCARLA